MKEHLTILICLERNDRAFAKIREICPKAEIRVGPWIDDADQCVPTELMKGAEVLFCEFPPANFHEFDQLKWIQLTSAGYAQIFDLPILEKKILVTNGLGCFDVPIAEWNIMMILVWHRNLPGLLANQSNKVWDRSAKFQSELRGSILGFYGYGGVARETARIAKSMGLTVWALTRDGKTRKRTRIYRVAGTGDPDGLLPDRVFGPDRQGEFLAAVDYLIVALPLTPATSGIIGEEELRMLKPSAVLINPARAGIIEETAYVKCLREGWIRGSSLDVHYAYPLPPEHPLWSMPNLIMTPHISGAAANPKFLERAYDIFVGNVRRYCIGDPLLNELTEAQLMGN